MSRTISIQQPFDLTLTLEMGQAFRWTRVSEDEESRQGQGDAPEPGLGNSDCWYSGVLGHYLVHLRRIQNGLEYRVGDRDGERHDIDLDKKLWNYFRLDDDIEAIYAQLDHDHAVTSAIEAYPGLRLLRQDPWECMVSYLCSNTNTIRGIRESVEKIATLSRRKVHLEQEERYVFPGPEQVVEAGKQALADLKLGLSSRSRNIFRMACHLACEQRLSEIKGSPEESGAEAVKRLSKCQGIGPKIAGCVALMSLDKLDAFPVDRWIRRALKCCNLPAELTDLMRCTRRPMTQGQQRRVSEWAVKHFDPYAGYANQYLFHWAEPHKDRAPRGRPSQAPCNRAQSPL